jgi:hypothetical protein
VHWVGSREFASFVIDIVHKDGTLNVKMTKTPHGHTDFHQFSQKATDKMVKFVDAFQKLQEEKNRRNAQYSQHYSNLSISRTE